MFVFLLLLCCVTINVLNTSRVLITGGAGFIGFHTAVKLAKDSDNTVVVLDIFDDSYSVDLKKARAGVLKEKGVVVHHGDVCSQQMLDYLFEEYDFSIVIHLAGKEGASASMRDPIGYTTANCKCLLVLLEMLKDRHKDTHFVYASSYSVYGNQDKKEPVSVRESVGPPISVYAALKIGMEEMVMSYCLEYQISSIGLRLFSVYGPWGRPDGDIYRITSLVDNNKQVEIYAKNSVIASRDYTYIDDVVNGIVAAVDYKPQQCGTVFNIGSGREPVTMKAVHKLVVNKLMKASTLKYTEIPLYEPLLTNADIEYTRTELGYNPGTTIEEGIKSFIDWYKYYHKDHRWKSPNPDHRIQEMLHNQRIDYVNQKYLKRIAKFKSKFEEYADSHNMPHVKQYSKKNFLEIQGLYPKTKARKKLKEATIEELRKRCLLIYECVAFDTIGRMYTNVGQQKDWKSFDGTTYLADIDICDAGITSCYGNCTCKYTGPSQAVFGCADKGFGILKRGDKHVCIELYSPHKITYKEQEFKLVDKIEHRNLTSIIKDVPYTRFNRTSLMTGAIAIYPKGRGKPLMMKEACDNTYHCLGFGTDGSLYGMIGTDWANDKRHDLYIRDFNYCSLGYKTCACRRTETGRYRCREDEKKKKKHH